MANRKDKYPDTAVFHYYNANPKNKLTCDCVERAIATALDIDYNTVLTELVALSVKTGYHIADKKCFGKYLESKGWHKQPQPRHLSDNTKYTGGEFCDSAQYGRITCVANIGGGHTVAIIKGKIYDTWNSADGTIGNYWVKY